MSALRSKRETAARAYCSQQFLSENTLLLMLSHESSSEPLDPKVRGLFSAERFAEPVKKAEVKVLQKVGGKFLMATTGNRFVVTFLLLFYH